MHFAGHADRNGLVFEDEEERGERLKVDDLEAAISEHRLRMKVAGFQPPLQDGRVALSGTGPGKAPKLTEHPVITKAIDRIGETRLGAPVIEHLRSKGWTFRYGWVPGGWGFAFPWKSIHVKPGLDEDQTLRVLTHEVFHAYLYEGALAASIEQEYNVEANALLLRHELARTPEEKARRAAELDAWFRVPMLEKSEEIRQATLWHWARLPQEQPTGLRGMWHALRQAVAIRELKREAPSKSSVA